MAERFPVACLLLALLGCANPLDLEGRACPCTQGWVCRPSDEICVRPGELGDAHLVLYEKSLDLGLVSLGWSRAFPLELHNPGNSELIISELTFDPREHSAFRLESAPKELSCDEELVHCSGALQLPARARGTLRVLFAPVDQGPATASLRIETSQAGRGRHEVLLRGQGTEQDCSFPVALARLLEHDEWHCPDRDQPLLVDALERIELQGLVAQDPEGRAGTFRWTVKEGPPGSVARFVPDASMANPDLWLDLAGIYHVQLDVQDADEVWACQPASIWARALPPAEGIYLELLWVIGDPDPKSPRSVTKLDLHLLHPRGEWLGESLDCFDPGIEGCSGWGEGGQRASDPVIKWFDDYGKSLEVIWLGAPEPGPEPGDDPEEPWAYRVGVHYLEDKGLGESIATLRVHIDGVLSFDSGPVSLPHEGFFRELAAISWPRGEVQGLDGFWETP